MSNKDQGWVKLYRKSIESGWLDNHKLWVFWCWCLLKATHKNHTHFVGYKQIKLKPGQFVFGLKKASKELKISIQSIRTILNFLKNAQNITVEPTNKYSIITICNWSIYQDEKKSKQHSTNTQLTINQQSTNNKQEYKNDKNEKNNKILHGEFVLLTKEENQKLIDKYEPEFTDACIERLDNYIGSTGKKYKSHYRTILSWVASAEMKTGEWLK